MKIDLNLTADTRAQIDYAMLKAALIAAQAATPTARACRAGDEPPSPNAAIEQMFAGALPVDAGAEAACNRFAAAPLPEVDGP